MRRLLLLALAASFPAAAQTLVAGGPATTFQITNYVTGLGQLTDFRFLPDGRVVMTEKTGAVKVRRTDGSVVTAGSFTVDSDSEKGLLGVEVDPQFATNTFLYFYASDGPSTANKHRVQKVRLNPDNTLQCTGSCSTAQSTVTVLLQNLRGPANHDGGGLAIGPDGKLYVGVGDTGSNSGLPPGGLHHQLHRDVSHHGQRQGAAHQPRREHPLPTTRSRPPAPRCPPATARPGARRIRAASPASPRAEIWSWGFRNPFRFWFDAQTGRLWVGDVGEVSYEEVDLVTRGQHYGWPWREGAFGYPVTTCDNLGANGGGADCVEPAYFCEHAGALGNNDGKLSEHHRRHLRRLAQLAGALPWALLLRRQRQRQRLDAHPQRRPGRLRLQSAGRLRDGVRHADPLPGRTGRQPLRRRRRRGHRRHLAARRSRTQAPPTQARRTRGRPTPVRPTPVLRTPVPATPDRPSTPGPSTSAVGLPRAASPAAHRSRARTRAGSATPSESVDAAPAPTCRGTAGLRP